MRQHALDGRLKLTAIALMLAAMASVFLGELSLDPPPPTALLVADAPMRAVRARPSGR